MEDLELQRLEEETQEQTDSGQIERRVTFIKRPSFLRVLQGSHWSKEVEKRSKEVMIVCNLFDWLYLLL